MLSRQCISKINNLNKLLSFRASASCRKFCSNNKEPVNPVEGNSINHNLKLGEIKTKYQVFRDEDSEIVLDLYEERQKYTDLLEDEKDDVLDPYERINLEHGSTGVFDIDDLVSLLKKDNAQDIFVAAVPPDIKYVDYLCVVTGRSHRHMLALAEFARRVYKQKKHKNDPVPKIEGETSKDWIALDLGNIALHIFSREARLHYDLDSLWSVGAEYDDEYHKQDPVVELLERHSYYLKDLQPAN